MTVEFQRSLRRLGEDVALVKEVVVPGGRLSVVEREEISRGMVNGRSFRVVARRLGRPVSTIAREVHRNGGRANYRAWSAGVATRARASRPRPLKLVADSALAAVVETGLERRWSPEQIAGRLRKDHPGDPRWRVSHETIYRSLYLQGRGGLRAELLDALRSGRAERRPRHVPRPHTHPKITGKVMISERPPEVADRAVPGHWEGDLIEGARHETFIGTLVERTSRFTLLVHLPDGKRADHVADRVAATIRTLPVQLVRSLTWDQGPEMARHARLTVDTGVQVYFCDPHSPWQRPTNENTNGLLRQYLPKRTDLTWITPAALDDIAAELNGRPRKVLDFMTPSEKFAEIVAMTA